MKDTLRIHEFNRHSIGRNRKGNVDILNPRGIFNVEHWRGGILLAKMQAPNTVMNAAKTSMWDTFFNAAMQVGASSWRMLLISSASYSAIAATDTMSSHSGWTEFTGYSETTRPAWGQGAAASQSITNSSVVTFTISSAGTVKGFGITSGSTKGGTAGLLFCAGLFTAGDAVVAISDELRVTYTANM